VASLNSIKNRRSFIFLHSVYINFVIISSIISEYFCELSTDVKDLYCLGPVNVRTHTSARVVNRASRFHRSAGLEDIGFHSSSGRESPCNASGSPSSSPGSVCHFDIYVGFTFRF